MITMWLRSMAPIPHVPTALAGFPDGSRVIVRDGGPTQLWTSGPYGWRREEPGMTLFDDLEPSHVSFDAYYFSRASVTNMMVRDAATLRLDEPDAAAWLDAMEPHRYTIEDAIGCTIDVDATLDGHPEAQDSIYPDFIECVLASFPTSQMKSMTDPKDPVGARLLAWIDQVAPLGADEISVTIPVRRAPSSFTAAAASRAPAAIPVDTAPGSKPARICGHPTAGPYFGSVEALVAPLGWHPAEDRAGRLAAAVDAWHDAPDGGGDSTPEERMIAHLEALSPADRQAAQARLFQLLLDTSSRRRRTDEQAPSR